MKKTYKSPRLLIFGSINELTLGSGSTFGESGPLSMATGGGGGGMGGRGGGGGMTMSDINLKQNLVRIGTHPLGFGLYLFNYIPAAQPAGNSSHFGVLAQEVEHFRPEAVQTHPDGYRIVDYTALGIDQYCGNI